jgi:CheY-like chemotaxis protein
MSGPREFRLPGGGPSGRVLVIDDDEFEREFLIDLLNRAGFEATGLPSMIGVTNHVVREQIDVVVLDIMMPTIRGDKLAGLLMKNSALADLGIVMVSALPEAEVAPILAQVRVDAFVSKANVRTDLAVAVTRSKMRRSIA